MRVQLVALVGVNTMLAPCAAALACVLFGVLMGEKTFESANIGDAMNGAVCGLVVVTPMAGASSSSCPIELSLIDSKNVPSLRQALSSRSGPSSAR